MADAQGYSRTLAAEILWLISLKLRRMEGLRHMAESRCLGSGSLLLKCLIAYTMLCIHVLARNRESLHTMWRYVQSPDAVVQILRIAIMIVEVANVGRAGLIPLKGIGCKDALLISIF